MKSVSIIGLNTWGLSLARYLKQFGYDVKGSTRTYEKVESARLQGLEAYQLELTPELNAAPEDINVLFNVDALVINIPPSRYFFHNHEYVKSIQNIINEALLHTVSQIIFISSTTVLGTQPGILNENTPPPIFPPLLSLPLSTRSLPYYRSRFDGSSLHVSASEWRICPREPACPHPTLPPPPITCSLGRGWWSDGLP